MNKENEKGLDNLFKMKLEDPVDQVSFREEDWGALEKMLNQRKKRGGIIFWLPVLSGVAALLLLFLGWWSFHPKSNNYDGKNPQQAVNHPKRENTGTSGGTKRQPDEHISTKPASVPYATIPNTGKSSGDSKKLSFNVSAAGARRTTVPSKMEVKSIVHSQGGEALLAQNPAPQFGAEHLTLLPMSPFSLPLNSINGGANVRKNETFAKVKPKAGYRPQFALSVMAAPDLNSVGSFQQSKVGTNEGLMFSGGVSRKLTISTGVIYSVKPYITGFENYHTPYQFPVTPANVSADCRMLDIPINIGYQVYSKQQNKISVGTGFSSYIMLHESYKFNYSDPYAKGPLAFTVPNSGSYFFGVLNLNATYLHQINSKFGISVQPYMKLPLSNIGYSQVRLQTTGVAIGLNWNLSSFSKP